mgnify:CR=1 FL=1
MEVLNPGLYKRLLLIFGDVRIANPGEPFIYELSNDLLFDNKFTIKQWGESYRVNCPFCYETVGREDLKQHLYISHKWGELIAGQRAYHLAKCFRGDCIKGENIKRLKEYILIHGPIMKTENPNIIPKEPQIKPVRLPINVPIVDLPSNHPAWTFLQRRGLDREACLRYDIRYSGDYDPDYPTAKDSIIFPIYMDGELVSWQARTLDPEIRIKYFTCPGTKIHNFLYGWDFAKDFDYAILVEGVFDVIRLGPPALGLFGKHISHAQAEKLKRFKLVFYLPDSDVSVIEARRHLTALKFRKIPVIRLKLSIVEDPADLDDVSIRKLKEILSGAVKNGTQILLEGNPT